MKDLYWKCCLDEELIELKLPPMWAYRYSLVFLLCFSCIATGIMMHAQWVDDFNAWAAPLIQSLRTPALTAFMEAFVVLCNPIPCMIILVCFFFYFAFTKRSRDAVLAAIVMVCGEFIFQGLKLIFENPRPVGQNIIELPLSYSFPSGHASSSVLLFGMLTVIILLSLRKRGVSRGIQNLVVVVAVVLIVCMGLARVYLGVHWATDVLAGWCIGFAWCIPMLCWFMLRAEGRQVGK